MVFSMKNLLTLIAVFVLIVSVSEAQTTIKRQVVAGGGILNQVNDDNIRISGMLGQPVIYKKQPTSPISGVNYDLHQGFWVPDPLAGTGVDDNPLSYNNGLTNYPNPVSTSTTIKFELKSPSYVSLKLYDMIGNVVATIFEGYQNAGEQHVAFTAKDRFGAQLTSGSYLYELQVSPSDMVGNNAFNPYMLKNIMIIVK
jgi:hypothetical protein